MTPSIRIVAPLLLTLLAASTGCDDRATSPSGPPTAPSPAPASPILRVFSDASGFSTSDLRDADDQIVQINSANELIWTADGTRLPGYRVAGGVGGAAYFIEGKVCPEGCAFEVRFGASGGEKRAYLTVDYGHWNPGTLVDVEVHDGELVVMQTEMFPLGTPTLSGVVSEMTPRGPAPLEGVRISRSLSSGWRDALTDENGVYEIRGLQDGTGTIEVGKPGYRKQTLPRVSITGDTRIDFELAAMPD